MARGTIRALRLGAELADQVTRRQAIAEILEALERTEGNLLHAAPVLGVSHRTLLRWLATYPALERQIGQLRARYGQRHRV